MPPGAREGVSAESLEESETIQEAQATFMRRRPGGGVVALDVLLLGAVLAFVFFLAPTMVLAGRKEGVSTHETTFFVLVSTVNVGIASVRLALDALQSLHFPDTFRYVAAWYVPLLLLSMVPCVLFAFSFIVPSRWYLRGSRRLAGEGAAELEGIVRRVAERLGVRRVPEVRVSSRLGAPAVIATPWGRAWLLVPEGSPEDAADPVRKGWWEATVAHEFGHLRNGEAAWFPSALFQCYALAAWLAAYVVVAAAVDVYRLAALGMRSAFELFLAGGLPAFWAVLATVPFLHLAFRAREHQADSVAATLQGTDEVIRVVSGWERRLAALGPAKRTPALGIASLQRRSVLAWLRPHPTLQERRRALETRRYARVAARAPSLGFAAWAGLVLPVTVLQLVEAAPLLDVAFWPESAQQLWSIFSFTLMMALFQFGFGMPLIAGDPRLLRRADLDELVRAAAAFAGAVLLTLAAMTVVASSLGTALSFELDTVTTNVVDAVRGSVFLLAVLVVLAAFTSTRTEGIHTRSKRSEREQEAWMLLAFALVIVIPWLMLSPWEVHRGLDGAGIAQYALLNLLGGACVVLLAFLLTERVAGWQVWEDHVAVEAGRMLAVVPTDGAGPAWLRRGLFLLPASAILSLPGLVLLAAFASARLSFLQQALVSLVLAVAIVVIPLWRRLQGFRYSWADVGAVIQSSAILGTMPFTASRGVLARHLARLERPDGRYPTSSLAPGVATSASTAKVAWAAHGLGLLPEARQRAVADFLHSCRKPGGGYGPFPQGERAFLSCTVEAMRCLADVSPPAPQEADETAGWLTAALKSTWARERDPGARLAAAADVAVALERFGRGASIVEVLEARSVMDAWRASAKTLADTVNAAVCVRAQAASSSDMGELRAEAERLLADVRSRDPARVPDALYDYLRLRSLVGLPIEGDLRRWAVDGLTRVDAGLKGLGWAEASDPQRQGAPSAADR